MIPKSAFNAARAIIGMPPSPPPGLAWHYAPLNRLPAILEAGYLRAHSHVVLGSQLKVRLTPDQETIILAMGTQERRPTLWFTVNDFMEPSIGGGVLVYKNALDDAISAHNTPLVTGLIDAIRDTPRAWKWARFGYPADRLLQLGPAVKRAAIEAGLDLPAGQVADDWRVSYSDLPLKDCTRAEVLTPELTWKSAPELIEGDDGASRTLH